MTKVTVREIRQNGGPADDRYYCGPLLKMYVIRVDGRRYDSRLTKRQAMAAAKKLANGAPVVFGPCTLMKYGHKPDVAQQEAA